MIVEKSSFGNLKDGKKVYLFSITNANDMSVSITNYGGIITEILVPGKNGKPEDVVLGYDNLSGYFENSPYFGAIIGRYGNRIKNGKFSLDEKPYQLSLNNGANHIHGGIYGFDKVYWEMEQFVKY